MNARHLESLIWRKFENYLFEQIENQFGDPSWCGLRSKIRSKLEKPLEDAIEQLMFFD